MPLLTDKINVSEGHILIWRLEESIDGLKESLPEWLDFSEYAGISHPQKKREWLAGRCLFVALCREAGIPFQGIWKSPEGKPFLLGSAAYISLSHSEHLVAAALHYHSPIGIDLERPQPKLAGIAPKFLGEEEINRAGSDVDLLCRYWSAKEAVFKLVGGKISFKKHIRVTPGEGSAGWQAVVSSPVFSGKAGVEIHNLYGYYLAVALRQPAG